MKRQHLFKQTIMKNEGYTVVELIIVITAMGIILVTMGIKFISLTNDVKTCACTINQLALQAAQILYSTEKLTKENIKLEFAKDLKELTPYLREESIPDCPNGGYYIILPEGSITCSKPAHKRKSIILPLIQP